jgi:acyl carrier protein
MKAPHVLRLLTSGRRTGGASLRGAPVPPGEGRRWNEQDAFRIIQEAIATVLDVPATAVTRQTRLAADLGADSLALVEIVECVEERLAEGWPDLVPPGFHFHDTDLELLVTVGDASAYAAGLATVRP